MPLPEAGPNVKIKRSSLLMVVEERRLPLVTVMKKLERCPDGNSLGEILTTGVIAVLFWAKAMPWTAPERLMMSVIMRSTFMILCFSCLGIV
jgi:hypothetical protein